MQRYNNHRQANLQLKKLDHHKAIDNRTHRALIWVKKLLEIKTQL